MVSISARVAAPSRRGVGPTGRRLLLGTAAVMGLGSSMGSTCAGPCEGSWSPVEADETTATGRSVADLVDQMNADSSARLEWDFERGAGEFDLGADGASAQPTGLTVVITPIAGTSESWEGEGCEPGLVTKVEIHLATEDGILDDTFEADVTTGPAPGAIELLAQHELDDPAAFMGNLDLSHPDAETAAAIALHVLATWGDEGFGGSVGARVRYSGGGDSSTGMWWLGSWPAG